MCVSEFEPVRLHAPVYVRNYTLSWCKASSANVCERADPFAPHVFHTHRARAPRSSNDVLFIHRHRRDNFQGLRLVSHRLHRLACIKTHIEHSYLKERATTMNEEPTAQWRHKTSGFNFISLFFIVVCVCFFLFSFLFVSNWLSLVRLPQPIAGFVLFGSFFVCAFTLACWWCCLVVCHSMRLSFLCHPFLACTRSFYNTCPAQSIRWAKSVVTFIIPQVKPREKKTRITNMN